MGLLERRNVRFETPSALSGQDQQQTSVSNGGVPPSPNTRRRAFNFTPISPRLTPDVLVPPSPGSNSNGQLRQLLSTSSGIASPFVSPRQTPVPGSCSSLPSSQPHSRHNSGHMVISIRQCPLLFFYFAAQSMTRSVTFFSFPQMSVDTPTSIVTCESSSVNSNDSAFVSPLNTPLSVNRSRHNSAANNGNGCAGSSSNNGCGNGGGNSHNLLVNRVRHSSGASVAIRHAPYPTAAPTLLMSMMNHAAAQDGGLLMSLNAAAAAASARSRHSSAGSPSLPRSAPLSPLVQNLSHQVLLIDQFNLSY